MSRLRPALGPIRTAFIGLGAMALAACSPVEDEADTTSASQEPSASEAEAGTPEQDSCAVDSLPLYRDGQLTVATDSPAYSPWFVDNDPTNGKGYESAVAYAVADELGFPRGDVKWVTVPFNASYQPGPKDFDFDINQISITPQRAERVTFSRGYYSAAQAVVTLADSPYASATSLADLADAKFGVQVGTTSLDAVTGVISPSQAPMVYDDSNLATKALENGQVDAIVVDLPTAYYITAAVLDDSVIAGQFQPTEGKTEEFGLLLEKDNELVTCLNTALDALDQEGTLDDLERRWLSQVTDVPELS
jgi:polar amino acid transport system substrate-binding protein